MQTKHTPGPWKVNGHLVRTVDETNKLCGLVIADVFGAGADNTQANARLIAAAPDLLRALQNLFMDAIALNMQDSQFSGVLVEAREAIAKATGDDRPSVTWRNIK